MVPDVTPYFTEGGITLYVGDCLEVLPQLPAESVDAIVTDPPYHLTTGKKGGTGPASVNLDSPYGRARITTGFMGKAWDGGDIAFRPEVWEAVLRVAKPGAHLLAFGGTRTSHRLVCAIEDAGWEIRDMMMWVYGSGFPKSLDVSKAIDRHGGQEIAWFGPWLRNERERRGITQKELAKHFPSKTGNLTGCVANWELGFNLPTADQFNTLCEVMGLPFGRIEEAERAVLETRRDGGNRSVAILGTEARDYNVTAPATEAAKQWDGWGTALKPAVEPIVLARKPLVGTVAANVQRYGTGALNIDASRIALGQSEDVEQLNSRSGGRRGFASQYVGGTDHPLPPGCDLSKGRWPANLIHDGSPEVVECFPESESTGRPAGTYKGMGYHGAGPWPMPAIEASSGNASRFFYVAKASKADRYSEAGNDHPTVKPVALIQYLIRLITPPGGVVLDPFSGSGTTPKAARDLGFHCIAIDLEERHQEIAKHRLNQTVLDFGGAA